MRGRTWQAIVVAAFVLAACSSGGSTTASPSIIASEEALTASSSASTGSASPSAGPVGDCLAHPSTDTTGQPCLQGTYDVDANYTEDISTTETRVLVSPLHVDFSLWAVSQGQLTGTAHLSYSTKVTSTDTEATSCKVTTAIVDPLGWDVQLAGQYIPQPDGSVTITFQATPSAGPALKERIEDCPAPPVKLPGVSWPALSAQLVGGVFDVTRQLPLPANSKGHITNTIHIQELAA